MNMSPGELLKKRREELGKISKGYNIPLEKLQEFSTIPLKDVKVVFKERPKKT